LAAFHQGLFFLAVAIFSRYRVTQNELGSGVDSGVELLLDYHWMLSKVDVPAFKLRLSSCGCSKCDSF
jgi:hypothetical protein